MKKRVNSKQLSQFYDSLANMLNSGLTIERGLDIMKEGKKTFTLWMIDGLQHHVARGGALWEGMKHYPKFFDDFQVMIVKGAEAGGMLVETFGKLGSYYENRHQAKRRFIMSLIYPILLLHAVILLPPLKYLLVENLERGYLSVVLPPLAIGYGIVVLMTFFWRKFCRTGPLRHTVDEIGLCIPVIGALIRDISLARAFWSLAAMLTAGMDAVTAARIAAGAAGNSVISRRLAGALYVLEAGRTFKEYFAAGGMLTSEQSAAVAVGEEAGALPESLEQMVRLMEEANSVRFATLMKVGGLVIYFIVAAVVAWTVLSFYTGYYNI
ncbi:MAG: hypothetical protein GY950_12370 [bacterium]|nr:hypothetical protein [bacterium]